MNRKQAERLVDAHRDWTGKFVQAQREAGQSVDVDAAKRRAEGHVTRVERDLERAR